MLLGQNVNSYGKTLEHPVTFAQLHHTSKKNDLHIRIVILQTVQVSQSSVYLQVRVFTNSAGIIDHNPDMKIILFGCMMQEQHVVDKIKKSYPFVNLVFGTHNIFKYAELFYEMLQSEQQIVDIWEGTDQIVEDLPTERNYTFKSGVNIMFGCNNFCSRCSASSGI